MISPLDDAAYELDADHDNMKSAPSAPLSFLVEWENGWKLHLHIILIKDMNMKGSRSRFVEAAPLKLRLWTSLDVSVEFAMFDIVITV